MSSWQSLFHLSPEQRRHHRIHLVGIGGTGLAPIAQVLLEMGFQVSGSDQAPSPRTETLTAKEVRVGIGHNARHLIAPDAPRLPDLVLASSAIADDNPEIRAAASEGIAVVKRKDLLGPLTAGRRVIAVAGTHGKTTTTGMIAHLLKHSDLQPGYIIGSDIRDLGIASAGRDSCFVIEADEYDDAFLGLRPEIIVLTNIDWDHPDYFPSAEAYEASFRRFASQLKPGGHVVFCQDDRRLRALASEHEGSTWVGYGTRAEASWKVQDVDISPGGTDFTLSRPPGDATGVHLAVPGFHNALNAAAALVVAGLTGIDTDMAAPLLADFRGAGRRFEIKGEKAGVLVVDDYAHHPTEIRATLAAGRAAYSERDIWAVYQPHTYSRTRALLERFEGVFAPADHVLVLDIYAAREAFDPSVTAAQVAAASRHQDAVTVGDLDHALAYLLAHVRTGSLVILLSAGSATELGPALLDGLDDDANAGDRIAAVPTQFFPLLTTTSSPSATVVAPAQLSPTLVAELTPFGHKGVEVAAPLAPFTSFRIGGPAAALLTIQRLGHLVAVLNILHRHQVPFLMLGGGSNILVSDAGIPGVVLLNHCRHVTWPADGPGRVRAESGAALAGLARSAIKRHLAGLAWAVSVPGTVGGAVVGNAGAHGGSIADNLQSATLWERGETQEVAGASLDFGYRRSRLKAVTNTPGQGPVILAATFHLQPDPEDEDAAKADRFVTHRRQTQPVDKSAGSIFKNPPGDHAGRLIEAAGLKDHAIGGAVVSPLHANFIVNRGNATAGDVVALMNTIRLRVYERFAVVLEPEILFAGDWSAGPTLLPLPRP